MIAVFFYSKIILMKVFRIAVCEDDSPSRDFETKLINNWAQKSAVNVSIDSYSSAENFLFESEDRLEYDLLLLDIQMGKMNGVELARVLRKRGFSGALVFLTGVKDYAIEGYEVGAVRYLLKPIKEEDFFKTLSLVYADFDKHKEDIFVLQTGNELCKIEYSRIVYIEARGHYVFLCASDTASCRQWKGSFGSVSESFEAHDFFCLRRGLLVNLDHVQKINRTECLMDNGEIIPIARGKYTELNEAFINHYRQNDGELLK